MQNKDRDELDETLDRALAGYTRAEPLAGLEERVLNRIRIAAAGKKRRHFWVWAAALAGLAFMIIMVGRFQAKRIEHPPSAGVALPLAVMTPAAVPQAQEAIAVRRTKHGPPPKQAQFPATAPLTLEERALLALVQRHPVEALRSAEMRKLDIDSLDIPAIQIQPLQVNGFQSQ